ncbi:MAG: extracellular solute-binding protein, partial [Devosia sp.]
MTISSARRTLLVAAATLALGAGFTVSASAEDVTLTYRVGSTPEAVATAERLIADFEAANPGIKIEYESGPGGTEGDNIVKTRLATGDMTDL